MTDMRVSQTSYDPQWIERFAEQRDAVTAVLAPWLAAPVEHVGSTAIPGLTAKPIIDILAPVTSLDDRAAMEAALAAVGWLCWHEDPAVERRLWFLRPEPALRTHHLHVAPLDGVLARGLIAFRDALRADAVLAEEYATLKAELAKAHPDNRNAYTNAKGDFVTRVLGSVGISEMVRERLPE